MVVVVAVVTVVVVAVLYCSDNCVMVVVLVNCLLWSRISLPQGESLQPRDLFRFAIEAYNISTNSSYVSSICYVMARNADRTGRLTSTETTQRALYGLSLQSENPHGSRDPDWPVKALPSNYLDPRSPTTGGDLIHCKQDSRSLSEVASQCRLRFSGF